VEARSSVGLDRALVGGSRIHRRLRAAACGAWRTCRPHAVARRGGSRRRRQRVRSPSPSTASRKRASRGRDANRWRATASLGNPLLRSVEPRRDRALRLLQWPEKGGDLGNVEHIGQLVVDFERFERTCERIPTLGRTRLARAPVRRDRCLHLRSVGIEAVADQDFSPGDIAITAKPQGSARSFVEVHATAPMTPPKQCASAAPSVRRSSSASSRSERGLPIKATVATDDRTDSGVHLCCQAR